MDELWALCFPYCAADIQNPLTVTEDGKVVSMLSRVFLTVCGLSAAYIYGVATHPDHRGRGLAGRLIGEALQTPDADLAALVPENPSLTGFYERFGFARRGRLPGDGRAVLVKALRGAVPQEPLYAELARQIQIFED